MKDELFAYYDRELSYLRKLGAEFAAAHPKIAGRLRLSAESVEDPHVARMLEGVAFLNARLRRKLDDDFPELTQALLGALYPHFLAPVPSLAIVQLECDKDLAAGHRVPAGTALETERVQGEPVRFRTTYPVETWPIAVEDARLEPTPFRAPATPRSRRAAAALSIELAVKSPAVSFAALKLGSLRFFLNAAPQHASALFELVHNDVLEVALAGARNDPAPALLDASAIRMVGFEPGEGLFPYPPQSFLGYRLLTEYFAFPQKFLFFEIAGLPAHKLAQLGPRLTLHLYLRRSQGDLAQQVERTTLALGCTPVVNLFRRRAEPIALDLTRSELRVVPDVRRPLAHEVYSVDSVNAVFSAEREIRCQPFFGLDRNERAGETPVWWHATRHPAPESARGKDDGTEVFLSLVDHGALANERNARLEVEVTCTNRDLPARLPFGGGQPKLALSDGAGPIRRIACLTAPTPTLRPQRSGAELWKLVSHLSLNHLSIGGADATAALREILRLYDVTGSPENRAVIEGVARVASRPVPMRVVECGLPATLLGTEVALELDPERFSGSAPLVFASVIERFLALYAPLNSFVQLAVSTTGGQGELRRWAPRTGTRPLL